LPRTSTAVNILRIVKPLATIAADCAPLLEEEIGAADAHRLAALLKVLADPARLRLLSLIQAQPTGEACVCHLTTPLGLSQPTVSHHLKKLTDAGLLDREQRGKWAYFSINPEAAERLAGLVDLKEARDVDRCC
jgi:ArsR family transcriptional regulator